jgi:hypothetical protein
MGLRQATGQSWSRDTESLPASEQRAARSERRWKHLLALASRAQSMIGPAWCLTGRYPES